MEKQKLNEQGPQRLFELWQKIIGENWKDGEVEVVKEDDKKRN